jgi:hypothetical protein
MDDFTHAFSLTSQIVLININFLKTSKKVIDNYTPFSYIIEKVIQKISI